ncbi:hypothetical protein K439DRAFT_1636073 [Ramaria rubella]|nr:hypothetical protein K439DRAFT_1636073 [Ramaria rubella]
MSSSFAASALVKQNVTYLDIVAAAILGYDYLLTVEREMRLVWPVPFNVGKLLFFLTRYAVFADTFMVLYHQFAILDATTCDALYKAIGFLLGVGTLIAETILAVRTWVIWHRDPRIGIILIVALVGFWTPVFYFLRVALYSLVFAESPFPGTPGCFLVKQNPILWAVFVFVMIFETLILALTLLKGIEHFRSTQSTLVSVLYRDGIMNYVYLCMLSIVNVVVLLTAPHGYSTLLTALQRVIHAVLSARILLHLREAAVIRSKSATPGYANNSEMGGFTVDHQQVTGPGFSFRKAFNINTPGDPNAYYGGTSTLGTTTTSTTPSLKRGVPEPEVLFGDSSEGMRPETVTWFGDKEDLDEDLGGGLRHRNAVGAIL